MTTSMLLNACTIQHSSVIVTISGINFRMNWSSYKPKYELRTTISKHASLLWKETLLLRMHQKPTSAKHRYKNKSLFFCHTHILYQSEAVRKRFLETIRRYQDIENGYRQKFRQRVERQIRIGKAPEPRFQIINWLFALVKPEATEEEIDHIMESDQNTQLFTQSVRRLLPIQHNYDIDPCYRSWKLDVKLKVELFFLKYRVAMMTLNELKRRFWLV